MKFHSIEPTEVIVSGDMHLQDLRYAEVAMEQIIAHWHESGNEIQKMMVARLMASLSRIKAARIGIEKDAARKYRQEHNLSEDRLHQIHLE